VAGKRVTPILTGFLLAAVAAAGLAACGPEPGAGAGNPLPGSSTPAPSVPPTGPSPSTAPTAPVTPSSPPGAPTTTPPAGGGGAGGGGAGGGGTRPPAALALSGVGYADRDEWARWRGWPVQIAETWNDAADTTANNKTTWKSMNALWSAHEYFTDAHWPGKLSLAQPMWADDQNVGSCASEDQITAFMGELSSAWPSKDAFIRLNWEFNGNWYRWSMKPGDADAFKTCWQRWHKIVKKASPNYKLVWNPNAETSDGSLDVTKFWPGAQYVDAAGPDLYAISDGGKLRDPNKTGSHGEPVGIEAWRKWVAAQGVPFAVPEWGVNGDPTYGSTDPTYITQMRTAFETAAKSPTGLAYEDYFDGSDGYNCKFTLHDKVCGYDYHAAAAARYLELWKGPYVTK